MTSRFEKIRNVGGVVLVASALYGCAPRTPDVNQVPSPVLLSDGQRSGVEEVSGWLARDVEANRNTMLSFDDVSSYQCRPIGLSKLYVMSDIDYPLVAIGAIFDGSIARRVQTGVSAIYGGIGFQPITGSTLRINLGEALTSAPMTSGLEDFIRYSNDVISRASNGLLNNGGIYVVVKRPASGIANALVFREGIAQFRDGSLSPQSCIRVRYSFIPTPIPVLPRIT